MTTLTTRTGTGHVEPARQHGEMRETIPADRIEAMVQRIERAWSVREATPAVGGYHLVYRLQVATERGERRCVLKATPESVAPVCGDEARLLTVLTAHSSVGVPEVFGVVDEDDTLPAPFFLAAELPGANYRRGELPTLASETLERAAHSLGHQLANLHQTSGSGALSLAGYGFVSVDREDTLDGGRPSSHPEQLVVDDAEADWQRYLEGTAEHGVGELQETRFSGMADSVQSALETRISGLSGPFEPALCRVDHSIENTVLDPETDQVQALLDWEFCVAATPAYDLAFAVDSFSGGLRTLIPGTPDRRDRIEAALLAGYRDAGGGDVVDRYRENGDCYRLLSDMHAMVNFESWFERSTASETQKTAAMAPLRKRVHERIRACQSRTR